MTGVLGRDMPRLESEQDRTKSPKIEENIENQLLKALLYESQK